ncbi:MAG: serine/threonine kinase PknH [Pseudonocardiales bacterium]|nr:serine/threonine kinase PknH [Pseudonocardiales bacterium]
MDQVTFGPYRILGLLGRGGMAEVHRAYDSRTDRVVALKLLPAEVSADEEYAARFRRECRSAARLSEAHVVPIHGFGEIDGRLYLDMRLVEGTDVATWLRMHGPMSPDVAVAVIGQVAQALDAAHAAGLVHRDVTPSNVVLAGVADRAVDASTVFAYLLDFGIARPRAGAVGPDAALLTRAGVLPGSPSYVAPERFSGQEGDPRADVYSLACVLHQLLTAQPPFTGDLPALIGAHVYKEPPRPSEVRPGVPIGFDALVARGMAKDPQSRFPSAGELATAARAVLGSVSSGGRVPTGVSAVPPTAPTVIKSDRGAGSAPLASAASAAAPSGAAPSAAAPSDADEVTLRFGPGPTAAAAPSAPGWTSAPKKRRRKRSPLLGGILTGLVVAAVIGYLLLQREPGNLEVLGATVAPAAGPGQHCDVTVDIVGTVRTNGHSGVITYRWSRSDGETTDVLSQSVTKGASSTPVHLLWKVAGKGRFPATATLLVESPNPVQAKGSFTYDCR